MCVKILNPNKIPKLRGQPLFLEKKRKVVWFLTFFCSTCVQKFSIVFEKLGKEHFRGHPVTPLWGRLAKKWKLRIVESIILSNFCSITLFKIFFVFEIYEVKHFIVLAPKIPIYVTFDLINSVTRFRLSRASFLLQ